MADILRFTLQTASQAAAILKKETLALEKNVRISTGIALTKTARIAVRELGQATEKYFDRPNPWTKRGFFFLPATKANRNTVTVGIKDDRAIPGTGQKGGNPAVFYLQPQVEGGQRNAKGIERKLRALGILGPNEFVVPGTGARRNRYGNIPRAQYSKLLADVQGANVGFAQGFGQATTTVGRKRYFYNPNLRPRGIWERYGRGGRKVRPFLVFVKRAPVYKKRFPFNEIVERTFDRYLDEQFEIAFQRGLQRRR